ncbi:MAG TPA: T9SS type A sorting domain-containing protein [bacterium]|nr:T9SS type A sorting domain-containing protein [bacterium]HPR86825.1 T9SS type A sorting domain-containing protein [bacterium]
MRIRALVTILALVLLSTWAFAQEYSARESFDYPIGATIDTLMGAAANGWQGGWYKIVAAAPNAAIASDAGLPYDDLNYAVPHAGNHLESVGMAAATEQRWGRRLDKTWPCVAGNVYWISVIMDIKNADDNATWIGVKYYDGDTGELGMFGKGHGLDKYTVGSGWHGSAGPEVSNVAWNAGPVWLLGKTVMKGVGNADYDTTYMWINPDPTAGEPSTTTADAVANTSMENGFNTIRIEFGGTVGNGLQVSFDELRLGTSYAAVSSDIYLVRESFEYPVGTSIDAGMGAAGNGWQDAWYTIVAAAPNAALIADTGLPYDDLNYIIPNVGNHLESVPTATATEQRWGRRLDKTWPNVAGTDYWISFIMDVKNATDNATWLGIKYYDGDTGELGMFGKGHGMDKYTVGSGWHGSAGPEVSSVSWDAGPVWIVGKTVMKGVGNADYDTTYMWINPDPSAGQPAVATADAVANTSMEAGFNTVRIEFGGTVGDGLQTGFDELRMGTSWGDVATPLLATAVESRPEAAPETYRLSQNYPNPFNPSTSINYTLRASGKIHLAVYDRTGREVAVLVDQYQNAGEHVARFTPNNLPSGVYIYKLQTADQIFSNKMVLVK